MKRPQFSIVSLLGVVTVAALGCAALVNASPVWAAILFNLLVLALMAAVVGGVYLRSSFRVFCGGFAIFGWMYFLFSTTSLFNAEQWLLTGAANNYVYSLLNEPTVAPGVVAYAYPATAPIVAAQPSPVTGAYRPVPVTYYPAPYTSQVVNSFSYEAFDRVAHSLWTILAGLAGGALATWLVRRASGREQATT